jgi:hypothetical protein
MNRQWDGYSGGPGGAMPVAYSPPATMQIPPSAVPVAGQVNMFPPMAVPGSPAVYGAPMYGAPMYGAPVSVNRIATLSVPAESTDEDIQKRILAMLPAGSTYVRNKTEVAASGGGGDETPLPPPPSQPAPPPPPQ